MADLYKIPKFQLDNTETVKTASFTIDANDNGKFFVVNSASPVNATLPTAVDAGDNFRIEVKNIGDGTVSFIGTIDGETAVKVYSKQSLTIAGSGAAFYSLFRIGLPPGGTSNQVLVKVTSASYDVGWADQTGGSGDPGESAYQIAVDNGFVGTEAEWLASLHGSTGSTGATGATGADGSTGATGAAGSNGAGVPTGGTTGQILSKINGTNYNTQWIDAPTGGGVATISSAGGDVSLVSNTNGILKGLSAGVGVKFTNASDKITISTVIISATDPGTSGAGRIWIKPA